MLDTEGRPRALVNGQSGVNAPLAAAIRFLVRTRLSQAAGHLTTTDEAVFAIARRTGYDTEGIILEGIQT